MIKHLFISALALIITISACKKETPKPLSDSIIGKYELSTGKYEYYNASGTKVFENGSKVPVGTQYEFDAENVKVTNADFKTVTGFYIVYVNKNDSKTYLTISAGDSYSDTYMLKSNTSAGLELYKETPFDTYVEGGTTKSSQKSVLNILLKRK